MCNRDRPVHMGFLCHRVGQGVDEGCETFIPCGGCCGCASNGGDKVSGLCRWEPLSLSLCRVDHVDYDSAVRSCSWGVGLGHVTGLSSLAHEVLVLLEVPIEVWLHIFSRFVGAVFEQVESIFMEVLDAVASPAFRRCGGPCCTADGKFGNAEEDGGIKHGFLFRPGCWVVASRCVEDGSKVHAFSWLAMVS